MVEIACLDLGQALRWLVPVIGNDGEFNENKTCVFFFGRIKWYCYYFQW